MILYDTDYLEQGARPHYTTKNNSFIRLAYIYKNMGIKNHSFHLALHDQSLADVDPHDVKHLTEEQRYRIAIECKVNYWYYIREVVRIDSHGSMDDGYFEASRANIAMSWVFLNKRVPFITIPRQLGKTTAAIVLTSWPYLIAGVKIQIGMFAKDDDLVQENVDRLKNIRDNLPQYLVNKISTDTENKTGLTYTGFHNKYFSYKPQTSKTRANGLSRGKTLAMEHWDELPYFKFNYLSYPAAMSTVAKGQPMAHKAGLRCANMITTTAGYLESREGQFAYNIRNNAVVFSEKMFDSKDEKQFHQIVQDGSTNNVVYMEFSYKQLGENEQWLEDRRRAIDDPDMFATDVLNQWIHGSGDRIFSKALLDELQLNKKEPSETSMIKTLILKWYRPWNELDVNTPLIFGVDTSSNRGKDFCTIVGVDPANMETAITTRTNTANLTYFAYCLVELMLKFPRSVLIPESNHNGQFLLDLIMTSISSRKDGDKINLFRRIYNMVVQSMYDDSADESRKNIDIDITDPRNGTIRKQFGFTTTGNSREFLFSKVMMQSIPRNKSRLHDASIIDEISSLVIRNGRVDHPEGGKDDTLVARLLADFFIMYGKNKHVYGIYPDEILSSVNHDGDTIDPKVKYQQSGYVERVARMEEALENSRLPDAVRRQYAIELRHLKPLINENIINEDVISVSQLEPQKKPDRTSIDKVEVNRKLSMLQQF